MATSAATVFGTMELLEMILLACSMEDVTCARRINTFVQATIDGSKRLRQKVFLEEAPSDEKLVIPDWRRRSTEVPLVVPSGDRTVRSGTHSREIVTLNPLLEQCTRTACPTLMGRWLSASNFAIVEQDFLDRGPGVWQQMLITQPPARSLELVVVKTKGPRSGVFKSKAQTLGALREELLVLDRGRTLRPRPAESPANSISAVGISSRTAVMPDDWRVAEGRVNTARLAEGQVQKVE